MTEKVVAWRGVAEAPLDWRASETGSDAPHSPLYDDIYFAANGFAEAGHVFVDGNRLRERFAAARRFVVGELGFGTGLNIAAAWSAWDEAKRSTRGALHFFSIEKHPLSAQSMARAHDAFPQAGAYLARLRAVAPPTTEGFHHLRLADEVSLTLFYGDVAEGLDAFDGACDAWFLDGFAPAKNPAMWSPDVMRAVAARSRPEATAATFTVAGAVRRALEAAGYRAAKAPGFGRKREMLTATLETPRSVTEHRPWFAPTPDPRLAPGARIAIVGGGIAGAALADALAAHAFLPTIFDRAGLASGASGNPAGLLAPRLDLDRTPAAAFFLQAFVEAHRAVERLHDDAPEPFFNPCGVLLSARTTEDQERARRLAASGVLPPGWLALRDDGLWLPQAGVVDPPRYVAALARDAEIREEAVLSLATSADGAIVRTANASERFDAAIVANGVDALDFVQARSLPLSAVAGQIDHFERARAPTFATAAGPYVAPAPGGGLVVGATYARARRGTALQTTRWATSSSLEAAAALSPELDALDPANATSRVGVRCQTPDRLPVVGAAPDWGFYAAAYDGLRDGRPIDYPPAKAVDRLYFLTGLGSRGLVTAPLAAAMIAASLAGAPSPVARAVRDATHPARFFIRDLKRAQRRRA